MSAVALGMGAISALPAAGDSLFPFWAILPMLFACVLLVWRTRSPVHWQALAIAAQVAVIALVGGAVLHHAMVKQGWTSLPFKVSFVSTSSIVHNVELLVQSYTNLAGGNFFGTRVNFANAATLASGLLFLAALICLPVELYRRAARSAPARYRSTPPPLAGSPTSRFGQRRWLSLPRRSCSRTFPLMPTALGSCSRAT
jgi:hypothetical protein